MTENTNNEMDFEPVSYTHLDVYKRQNSNSVVSPSGVVCFTTVIVPGV